MRWKVVVAVLAVPVLLAQGALAWAAWDAADKLVHPPRDLDARTPADVGLAFEAFRLPTRDGLGLAAWFMPAEEAEARAPVVVFLHGYGASKAQSLAVAPFLNRAGYHVLSFDFRGHGESDGGHTTLGIDEVEDVRAALHYLAARPDVDAERVALFGWSMGAATALNAAPYLDVPVRAIVVDSPFSSLSDVAARAFRGETGLPDRPFVQVGLAFASWMTKRSVDGDRPIDKADDVGLPMLIIQGVKDALLGPDTAERFHERAPRSQLWLVPEAAHVEAAQREPDEYSAKVLAFLAASL